MNFLSYKIPKQIKMMVDELDLHHSSVINYHPNITPLNEFSEEFI